MKGIAIPLRALQAAGANLGQPNSERKEKRCAS